MSVAKGGEGYGFCPGKATWDQGLKVQFDELVVIAETKWPLVAGGVNDQPGWLIDLLAWFLPKYDTMKFIRKADMILGSNNGKTVGGKGSQPAPRQRKK